MNISRSLLWVIGLVFALIVLLFLVGLSWLSSSVNDYSKLGWLEAFDKLHRQVEKVYPFGEWKAIDWDMLYEETAEKIKIAETKHDEKAYYIAIREYAYAFNDGHVQINEDAYDLRETAIKGGYGLGLIALDDGKVIAHILQPDGPATQSGMAWGAEIIAWNGEPIHKALAETSTLWAENGQATIEVKRIEQAYFISRAPIGTQASITFINPGESEPQKISLIAKDDGLSILDQALPQTQLIKEKAFNSPIQSEILESGIGYIQIKSFMPNLGCLNPVKQVDRIIERFLKEGVSGVIIDVRGNVGGVDAFVPKMLGHFYDEERFYEKITIYDDKTGQFELAPEKTLLIQPRKPYFGGQVIVLVDHHTISTAEGIPLAIQKLPQGQVVGVYGTFGSFALGDPGKNVYKLPTDISFSFFEGRSLDENGIIQVDGNDKGIGGIAPDIRVPLTYKNVYAWFVEGKDIVLDTAIETLKDELD